MIRDQFRHIVSNLRNIGMIKEYDALIKKDKSSEVTIADRNQMVVNAAILIKELRKRKIDFDSSSESSIIVAALKLIDSPMIKNDSDDEYVYPGNVTEKNTALKTDVSQSEELFNTTVMQGAVGKFVVHQHTINKDVHWDIHMSITGPNKVEHLVGMMLLVTELENNVEGLSEAFNTEKRILTEFQQSLSDNTLELVQDGVDVKMEEGTLKYVDSGKWVAGPQDNTSKEFIFGGEKSILKGRFILQNILKERFKTVPVVNTSKVYFLVKPKDQSSSAKKEIRSLSDDFISFFALDD